MGSRSSPRLDLEILDELRGIRDAEGRSLLVRRGPSMLAALREAASQVVVAPDAAERARSAHSLKGLAASLGARRLAELAAGIEAGGSSANEPDHRALDALRNEVEATCRAIEPLLVDRVR